MIEICHFTRLICFLLVSKRRPCFKKHQPLHRNYTWSMWLSGKEYTCNAGDLSLIPGSGGTPGEGNGNPPWYILAWEIPWIEEPDGLQSMGSQWVGHNLMTTQASLHLTHFLLSRSCGLLFLFGIAKRKTKNKSNHWSLKRKDSIC